MSWFEGFAPHRIAVNHTHLHVRLPLAPRGERPVLLLLHGFPQTHALWHRVAQQLQNDFHLVLPDLRGYGDSAKAPGLRDHSNYSKRVMAQDMVALMDALGVARFAVCGHDRGARVAHRLALDHPQRVEALALIDIAPTLDMVAATNFEFARAYEHWFSLIQPAPLPEQTVGARPLPWLHAKLGGWGADGLAHIERRALAEYERCFCLDGALHAMCEDYRASAGIDLEHDRASRALQPGGGRIACDTLLLWGRRGVVHRLFDVPALWQAQCQRPVQAHLIDAGHYIPEERPEETAALLSAFVQTCQGTGA